MVLLLSKREKPLVKLFLRPKPVQILIKLRSGPKYATVLSKEVDCTYSHTVKLLTFFKKIGLVDFEKKGRIKLVSLTSEGKVIANSLYDTYIKLSKSSKG